MESTITADQHDKIVRLLGPYGLGRVSAYMQAYSDTGLGFFLDLAQISSGTGFFGGVAWHANKEIFADFGGDFFGGNVPTGNGALVAIEAASNLVALGVIGEGFKNNNDGTYTVLTASELLQVAEDVWAENDMPTTGPGFIVGTGVFPGDLQALQFTPGSVQAASSSFSELRSSHADDTQISFVELALAVPDGYMTATADEKAIQIHDQFGSVRGVYTPFDVVSALSDYKYNYESSLPAQYLNPLELFGFGSLESSVYMDLYDNVAKPRRSIIFKTSKNESGATALYDRRLGELANRAASNGLSIEPLLGNFNDLAPNFYKLGGAFQPIAANLLGLDATGDAGDAGDDLAGLPDYSELPPGAAPFAEGGVMTSHGVVPLHRYGMGGVAASPQLAMFGEGSLPEAFVPLPDGRSIPVSMAGGGFGGAEPLLNTPVTVNVQAADGGDAIDSAAARDFGAAIGRAVQEELEQLVDDSMRPGGILSPI